MIRGLGVRLGASSRGAYFTSNSIAGSNWLRRSHGRF